MLTLEETQTSAALRQTVDASQSDLALLEAMGKIAEANHHCQDLRIHTLEAFLRQHFCSNPGKAQARWEPTRLLIFTDSVDTERYLEHQLRALLGDEDANRRIASFTGGMADKNREPLKGPVQCRSGGAAANPDCHRCGP